jgi:hypothetical protein
VLLCELRFVERWDLSDSVTAKLVLPLYDVPSTKRQAIPQNYNATKRISQMVVTPSLIPILPPAPLSPSRRTNSVNVNALKSFGMAANSSVDDLSKSNYADSEDGDVPLHKEV